jgi:hypothetical protein
MDTVTDIKIDNVDALRHLIGLTERIVEPSLVNEIKTLLNFELENHNVILPSSILSKLKPSDELEIDSFDSLLQ